jgi:threonine/homoserine/homoserine lactone efflux protein
VNVHLLGLYVAAVFLAMIAPGPDMLFVLATGTRGGPRAGRFLSRRRRARQALDVGAGTIMIGLAGRLALER